MSSFAAVSGLSNPYSYYAAPISGKMEVPVPSSQSLFAQFRYVQGVPSSEGGLSLDRVQIIDSLLAQINAHRQGGTPALKRHEVDLAKPDDTIRELSAQAWKMQQENPLPYQKWGHVQGLVLNVHA